MEAVLAILASRLKTKFTREVVGKGGITKALQKLVEIGTIPKPKLGRKTAEEFVTDGFVTEVIGLIKGFQKDFGLSVDGKIGEQTAKALKNLIECFDNKGPDRAAPKVSGVSSFGAGEDNTIRYHIESLPKVANAQPKKMLKNAWKAWEKVCNINPQVAVSADQADVIIRTDTLDGQSGSELARASIGPPKGRLLTFVIDKDETFSKETTGGVFNFQAMCVHEIGHLLGLKHQSAKQGEVMFGTHQPNILKPTQKDIDRAVAKFGPVR